MASKRSRSSSETVSMTIRVPGSSSLMSRVASRPSHPGISMSISRHLNVHQDDVWACLPGLDDGFPTITRLAQHEDPWTGSKEGRKTFAEQDRKSTRLNSSHVKLSYAVCCS